RAFVHIRLELRLRTQLGGREIPQAHAQARTGRQASLELVLIAAAEAVRKSAGQKSGQLVAIQREIAAEAEAAQREARLGREVVLRAELLFQISDLCAGGGQRLADRGCDVGLRDGGEAKLSAVCIRGRQREI